MAMSREEAKLILQWEKWYRNNGINSPFSKEVIEKAEQLQSKGTRLCKSCKIPLITKETNENTFFCCPKCGRMIHESQIEQSPYVLTI